MARRRAIAAGSGGFTLIELLLVIAIIGILIGVIAVVGSFDTGRQKAVQNEAERLALAVELARTEALYRNEVWGLAVDRHGYRFQRLVDADGSWIDVARPPFSSRVSEDDVAFSVATTFKPETDFPQSNETDRNGESGLPSVLIHPGGEITPFEITVSGAEHLREWVARTDGIQRTRARARGEPDDAETLDLLDEDRPATSWPQATR